METIKYQKGQHTLYSSVKWSIYFDKSKKTLKIKYKSILGNDMIVNWSLSKLIGFITKHLSSQTNQLKYFKK